MANVTLASGPVTNADQLSVEMVTPPDAPPTILLVWPGGGAPSVSTPRRFPADAIAVIALLDRAMLELQRVTP